MSRNETFSTAAIRECIEATAVDAPELAAKASAELARLGAQAEGEIQTYLVLEPSAPTAAFHAISDSDAKARCARMFGAGRLLAREVGR